MRTLALLLTLVAASAVVDSDSDKEWKEKPIQKVVRLLKEMQAQVQKEADEDEDMYDKLGCWCDTNEKEKTKASAINTQRITDLTAAIEEFTAKSAQLKVDIENLKTQVGEQTGSLDTATALREKESAEFHASEKDAVQNIASLKTAVMKLEKVQPSALDQESLMQIKGLLKKHFQAHRQMFDQHRHAYSFAQQKGPSDENVDALLQASGEYAPQSGQIFGILKSMKESMETNLVSSQKEEATAKDDFASMKSSKTDEIAAANELMDSKKVELASTDEKLAASKNDLEETEATLAADTEFLANLKKKCTNADAEYMARQKVRSEEIQAISETLSILTDDEAKDLMLKFTQVEMRTSRKSLSNNRARAVKFLHAAAKKFGKPQLAALAVSVKNDVFAKVKENIDLMVAALKQEQADEVKTKDFCTKEFHENDMQTTEKTDTKEDLKTAIADLESSKTTLAEEIEAIKAEIDATHVEMKQASELRVSENKEFQMTVVDATATQEILAKALDKLKGFYASKSFLQKGKKTTAKQPGYKKNSGASSIMSMIENIIQESKDLAKEALTAENEASASYETYMKDAAATLKALSKEAVSKQEELAGVDEKKATAEGDLKHTDADLIKLMKYKMGLHQTCDFVTKYFDVRQQKRSEEIEALAQAKAIFSGAVF